MGSPTEVLRSFLIGMQYIKYYSSGKLTFVLSATLPSYSWDIQPTLPFLILQSTNISTEMVLLSQGMDREHLNVVKS